MYSQFIKKSIVCHNCKLIYNQIRKRHNQLEPNIKLRLRENKLKDLNYNKILRLEDEPKSVIKIRKDPKDKIILIFGGEESATIDLDNPIIYEMFKKAEDVFGYNLIDVCLNGPSSQLNKTKYLLPCVFLANHTALFNAKQKIHQLEKQTVEVTSSGIGELNALVFNDVLSFDDALKLLKIRTDAMQLLADNSNTRSIVIWESAATKPQFMCRAAKEWCLRKGLSETDSFCEITHWLHPETKIIGGHSEAIEFILKNSNNFALKKIINLNYDLAYYSSYLKPIQDILLPFIKEIQFNQPTIKIRSTTGQIYKAKNLIKNLSEQVCTPVQLESNFTHIYHRKKVSYPLTYELSSKRTSSISLRSANFQAYKRLKSIIPF